MSLTTGFLYLWWKRRRFDGQILALTILMIGTSRFFEEMLRSDVAAAFPAISRSLTIAQWTAFLLLALARRSTPHSAHGGNSHLFLSTTGVPPVLLFRHGRNARGTTGPVSSGERYFVQLRVRERRRPRRLVDDCRRCVPTRTSALPGADMRLRTMNFLFAAILARVSRKTQAMVTFLRGAPLRRRFAREQRERPRIIPSQSRSRWRPPPHARHRSQGKACLRCRHRR